MCHTSCLVEQRETGVLLDWRDTDLPGEYRFTCVYIGEMSASEV